MALIRDLFGTRTDLLDYFVRVHCTKNKEMKLISEEQRKQIEDFVRNELGCQCPPEVFADIKIVEGRDLFPEPPIAEVYEIGGRLMVAMCEEGSEKDIVEDLEAIIRVGMKLRDERGFNRFRLVIKTIYPDLVIFWLKKKFDNITDKDDRVHVHAVKVIAEPANKKIKDLLDK